MFLLPRERGRSRVDGLAEARIAARVRHPNVAAVHDVVEQDRSCWLVMEYVAADTLAMVLRRRRRLPPPIVAAVGLQLLAALRAVHEAGVVHCDVKPANLLLGDDGRLVLVDFGIAEVAGDTPVARDDGEIVGSPAYMAPELIRGALDAFLFRSEAEVVRKIEPGKVWFRRGAGDARQLAIRGIGDTVNAAESSAARDLRIEVELRILTETQTKE